MRHARLEPDVDDVLLFFESRAAALRAGEARRQDTSRPDRSTRRSAPASPKRFAARRATRGSSSASPHSQADQRRNRRSPGALTRETPLRMRLDHLALARASPFGNVLHRVGCVDGALAQQVLIHRDKPLRRRAEDHRIVAAPAVRIGMLVLCGRSRARRCAQILDDLGVRIEDLHARIRPGFGGEAARGVDRVEHRQSVLHPGIEVVGAVARRGVHGAGSGFELDVVGEHDHRVAIQERMAHREIVELRAARASEQRRLARSARRALRCASASRDDHRLVADAVEAVRRIGSQRDRDVRRQRPRRRRPDEKRNAVAECAGAPMRFARFARAARALR